MDPTTSAIRAALYRGDRETALRLAEGAAVDIFEAACLGDAATLGALIADDADVVAQWSDDGFTALHFAAFLGSAECVQLLVEAGADVGAVARNEMQVQPLHSAAAHHDLDACRVLLDAGADPNARQQGGYTALDEARLNEQQELIALLVERGAVPQ
jgi:ankyrin repeat protein